LAEGRQRFAATIGEQVSTVGTVQPIVGDHEHRIQVGWLVERLR